MIERLLIGFDVGWPGAAYRAALGFAFLLAFRGPLGQVGAGAGVAAFLLMLFCLKAAAALLRRLVSAPPAVKATWERRRFLARHHDSYQWRKVLWFGVGMAAGVALGGAPSWGPALAVAGVAAGLAGEAYWRLRGPSTSPDGD